MEIWKDIIGYEGLYQVSNYGRIKSLKRFITCGHKNSKQHFIKERILKTHIHNGYSQINIRYKNKSKMFLIHRLVARAFILNPNNLKYVNHIDENKSNNSIENLEWKNHRDNVLHSQRKHPERNWSLRPVNQILNNKIINTFESMVEAQNKTGCDHRNIQRSCKTGIKCKGFNWQYIN